MYKKKKKIDDTIYSFRQSMISKFTDALANPARVTICQYLLKYKSAYFGDIHKVLPLSKATVSQHLAVLKASGLVKAEILTPHVRYSIHADNWDLANEMITTFLNKFDEDRPAPEKPTSDATNPIEMEEDLEGKNSVEA